MKLEFHIHYKTAFGQTLHAVLHRQNARPQDRRVHVELDSPDGENWHGETVLHIKQPLYVQYHYEVRRGPKVVRSEWQTIARCVLFDPHTDTYVLHDQWQDLPAKSWLYCACITERIPVLRTPATAYPCGVSFQVQLPNLPADTDVGLCGNLPSLGNWQTQGAPMLYKTQPHTWKITLNAAHLKTPFEYKFFLRNRQTNHITWEEGPNRILTQLPVLPSTEHVYPNLRPQFLRTHPFRLAGVVVPVFSLRSQTDSGTGDFGDLKLLVDWAVKTGQKVIQLLPVHDTTITKTWTDSYPYNAISVYALHPLYADVRALPKLSSAKKTEQEQQALNKLSTVDYERALRLKLTYLQHAFDEEGERVLGTPQFHEFLHQNAHWLPAYAMFCVLRDTYKTADFHTWPEHAVFSDEDLHRFCASGTEHEAQLHFWYYVQFVLHTQLQAAAAYARKQGVILKGDIPIGISPFSVEAWTEPQLFHLNAQAGAPPDDFSATGQNWGFPTYNWEVMARDNYRWWRQRLKHMARYFDVYRLDHVLGFFRIWQIPLSAVDGLLGQFSPALPLSQEEIESFGLPFKSSFLRPHISANTLEKLFDQHAPEIEENFLIAAGHGLFKLREEFDTERKLAQALAGPQKKYARFKESLFALCDNVLFVRDSQHSHLYHPRIAAMHAEVFQTLSAQEQQAFIRLYNDFFFHRHNEFWKKNALTKLPALTQCTQMLCCAEDLGMVPASVPDVMRELQILSLEIQRMPKKPSERFADIFNYPYLSVATPSTHDMSVLRAWWKEDRQTTQHFWNDVLKKSGNAPEEMSGEICEEILNLHLKSNSMLALIGWQDWLGMDEKLRSPHPEEERINVPADPHHYWRYRMHLTLEELLQADGFNAKIKEMIKSGKR